MASSSVFTGSRGRRREIQNPLNLVPFIDLFSTIIIFLIATAVWDQLAEIQIKLGTDDKPSNVTLPQDVQKIESNVKITVGADYVEIFDEGQRARIERDDELLYGFDLSLVDEFMASVRDRFEDKRDMLVMADDDAHYAALIGVMDYCLKYNFEELIVAGTSAAR